ncbi:DUF2157 domain-containing protein [Anaeromyxobacter oryzae]|uniref:DUF2157 domain-containing protein n=1 Tax=Anaeromyxobacter oryzae TaxID=2918170 RepID=A0ABM7WV49_9BACT|nr:DUF2157 domain-containing protein [Anaeromyxobacter oryzae]BDG03381.1 hypothetical protein AMOR_23770 [Anaeromyxobacter oryzae]
MDALSRGFRDGLRQELPRWRDEGLVSPDAAAAIHARYRLAEPESGLPGFLAVYVLGALLAGAGIVSLVAWHWEGMTPAVKLAVIGSAMIALHAGGVALHARAPRLGHAIAFLGTLVFGANVGLVAQIFHVSGVWWGGFAAFAAGALAAGLLYESVPHLLLASVLALSAAGPGIGHDHPAPAVAGAWAVAAIFLVLAWRARSRTLVVLTGIGLAATLVGALDGAHADRGGALLVACLGAAFAAAPLALAPLGARSDTAARLGGAARVLGRIAFAAAAFTLSFTDAARWMRFGGHVPAILVVAAAPALAIAAAALLIGLRRDDVEPLARGEAMLLAATTVAFAAGLSLESGRAAALVANLALAFLAAGRIVRGMATRRRAPFWEGMGLAGLLLLARFLEEELPLWVKGTAFLAAGVAVIVAGAAFERRRARAEVA